MSLSGWFGPEGQLYSEVVATLGVDNDSGMFMAGYAGIYASSLCSLLAVLVVDIGSCMLVLVLLVVMQVLWLVLLVLRCVSFVVVRPMMLGIMAGMTRRTFCSDTVAAPPSTWTLACGVAGFFYASYAVFPKCRARRRHRQLHVPAGFADDAIRAVLPSISDRPMVDVWCPAWTRQLACPLVCNFLGCRRKTAECPQLHFIDEVGFTCLSLCNGRCFSPGSALLLGRIISRSRWADRLVFWGRVRWHTDGESCPQGHGSPQVGASSASIA